jgi:hypothetical protein
MGIARQWKNEVDGALQRRAEQFGLFSSLLLLGFVPAVTIVLLPAGMNLLRSASKALTNILAR